MIKLLNSVGIIWQLCEYQAATALALYWVACPFELLYVRTRLLFIFIYLIHSCNQIYNKKTLFYIILQTLHSHS